MKRKEKKVFCGVLCSSRGAGIDSHLIS